MCEETNIFGIFIVLLVSLSPAKLTTVVLAPLTHISDNLRRIICIEHFERIVYVGRVEGDSGGPDAYISGAQRRVVAKEEGKHALPSRAVGGACCMCGSIRTHI